MIGGILPGLSVLSAALAVFSVFSLGESVSAAEGRNLGIEGRTSQVLPRSDYQARPVDDRSEVLLHVQSVVPADGGFRYDIHFMGLEPGEHALADFLTLPDGSRPADLDGFRLHVRSGLPDDHNGQLEKLDPSPFPFIGGYRVFLGSLGFLWIAGIGWFVWSYRKRAVTAVEVLAAPEPGFAERIRPLVEAAAAGTITLDEKTLLERLLMGFWRERLDMGECRVAEAILLLKQHPTAGELLRAMERWLHTPGGSPSEIHSLLEPYRAGDENLMEMGVVS